MHRAWFSSRARPTRITAAALSLFLVSCEGWEIFQSGDTVLGDDPYILSLLNAESCPLPKGLDPKEVSIVSYNIRVRGQHPEKVPANYFYASLLTTDGARYLAGYEGCQPLLSGTPLAPGDVAEGYLNFPVPPGKIPAKLVYAPVLTGQVKGESVVELSLGDEPQSKEEGAP